MEKEERREGSYIPVDPDIKPVRERYMRVAAIESVIVAGS